MSKAKIHIHHISEEEENAIWKNPLVIFDTSALCRFYSLTEGARQKLIQLLSEMEYQMWLPSRVLLEFNRHKNEERQKPLGKYVTPAFLNANHFESKFNDFLEGLKKERHKHPFVPESYLTKWASFLSEYHDLSEKIRVSITTTLNAQKKELQKSLENDEIDDFVSSLPAGDELGWDELMKIVQEGTVRYANKIPPGYEDDESKTSIDKYGDLIIWKEIISKAKIQKKDVILITQDLKEDWNTTDNGGTIIPREELLKEFRDLTDKSIWMYTISDFLKRIAKKSGIAEDNVPFNNLLLELNLASIPDDCIKVECPECKRIIGFSSDDIDWDWDSEVQDYRSMGEEFCHTVTAYVECPECFSEHELVINAYEYPIGVINYIELESGDLEILSEPDLYAFVQDVPINQHECCERCGEWTDELDEMGFCQSCHNDFDRFLRED